LFCRTNLKNIINNFFILLFYLKLLLGLVSIGTIRFVYQYLLSTLSGSNTKTGSAADEIEADARAAAPGVDLS
jgi:hypothetical protein